VADLSSAYELAYIEARRALEDQRAVVNELRGRAGVLVAAAAITTSFFGDAALTDGRLGIAGWAAVAAFVLAGVRILAILWPLPGWTFAVDARVYMQTYLEHPHGGPSSSSGSTGTSHSTWPPVSLGIAKASRR
jgi:hypothetical protein